MMRRLPTKGLFAGMMIVLIVGILYALSFRGRTGRTDAWDIAQERGTVRVGMDASYPPFEWIDAAGEFQGFDVGLAQLLAERWGVQAELVNIHFDGLYDALHAERVDLLLSALPYDRMLTRDVGYSSSYFYGGQVMVVREDGLEAESLADLNGKTIAVEMGTEGHLLARQQERDGAVVLDVLPLREMEELVQAVLSGEADALICDRVDALALSEAHPLEITGRPLTDEPYVMAVRPDSTQLLDEIETALDLWRHDGTLEALQQQWFGSADRARP